MNRFTALLLSIALLAGPMALDAQESRVFADDPVVSVGIEGEVFLNRVVDAVPLPDGRYAVADAGDLHILIVEPSGAVSDVWGGPGEGPGEFRSLQAIALDGPHLLAWDPRSRRVTRFDAWGTVAETVRIESSLEGGTNPDLFVGPWEQGYLVGTIGFTRPEGGEGTGADAISLVSYDGEGRFRERVGDLRGFIRYFGPSGGGPILLSPAASVGILGDDAVFANGAEPRVSRVSASGRSTEIALQPFPQPVSRADAWRAIEARVEGEGDLGEMLARAIETQPRDVGEVPYFSRFVVDPERGRLWVKPFSVETDPVPFPFGTRKPGGPWLIFDESGAQVGRAEVPERFILLGVHGDTVLGVRLGAFDEQKFVVLEAGD